MTNEQRREKYIRFVDGRVKKDETPVIDAEALEYLAENYLNNESVYDITRIEDAKRLYRRLLKGGDLHQENIEHDNMVMSAAMGQYVAFLKHEQSGK